MVPHPNPLIAERQLKDEDREIIRISDKFISESITEALDEYGEELEILGLGKAIKPAIVQFSKEVEARYAMARWMFMKNIIDGYKEEGDKS